MKKTLSHAAVTAAALLTLTGCAVSAQPGEVKAGGGRW